MKAKKEQKTKKQQAGTKSGSKKATKAAVAAHRLRTPPKHPSAKKKSSH